MELNVWKKSSRCSADSPQCVEVLRTVDGVRVRDSKDPHGLTLRFTDEEWAVFLSGAKGNEFDVEPTAKRPRFPHA